MVFQLRLSQREKQNIKIALSVNNRTEIPFVEVSDPAVFRSNPVVSVSMITYNHEGYIEEAVRGVISQEFDLPYELVIGEDCSSDRTRQLVLQLQRKYPDIIRIITSDSNVGMVQNLIRVNNALRGEFVAFCEGDDVWIDPLKMKKQVEFLQSHPDFAICCTNVSVRDEIAHCPDRLLYGTLSKTEFTLDDLDYILTNMIGRTVTVMYRKSAFVNPPSWFFSLPYTDMAMMLLIMQIGKMKYLNDVTAMYRIHHGGCSTSRHESGEFAQMVLSVAEALKNHFYPKYAAVFDRFMCSVCCRIACKRRKVGHPVEAGLYLIRAMKYAPIHSLCHMQFYKACLQVISPQLFETLRNAKTTGAR